MVGERSRIRGGRIMMIGNPNADFQHQLDPFAHRRRCAFCGGDACSWVVSNEGRSVCTSCYQGIRNALRASDSQTEGGFPRPNGLSHARPDGDANPGF